MLISWGSFFVQRNAVPARVGLCLICFLTLTSRAVFVQGQMPISDGSVLLLQVIYVSIYFVREHAGVPTHARPFPSLSNVLGGPAQLEDVLMGCC